ncbi:hypothetical protein [Paenibacillus sp. y28]|uniref:hypothetical protein n=1 Tax=Paenibacillus sp. y28 TaxID=3129110 RepID=UPI00301A8F94
MKIIIHLSCWSLIWTIMLVYQVQDRYMSVGEHKVYSSIIGAAHDAAVVSRKGVEEGRVIFDEELGTRQFRASLAANLRLYADDLSPQPDSMFGVPLKIVGLFFLGDDKAPQGVDGFPVYPWTFTATAEYRGGQVPIRETIYGPSVVGVIEFTHNVNVPGVGKPVTYKKATYRYYDRALYLSN